MKKEVLIAIILGFGLGLVITFGIWTANRALQEQPVTEPIEATPTPQATPTPASNLTLEITEPEQNSISSEKEINLAGSASPEAIIVVFYEEGEKILETDSQGKFETTVNLAGGANEILIKAFDKEGGEVEKTLSVVYSTAEI
jgi:hypothetical protein